MDGTVVLLVVFFGLYIITLHCQDVFYIVRDAKTWSDAQRYCRDNYNDLATINTNKDMCRLSDMLKNIDNAFWIGLYGNISNFLWSMERERFHGEQLASYTNWNHGQPNVYYGRIICTTISTSGSWSDKMCSQSMPFLCYDGTCHCARLTIFAFQEGAENKYVYVKKALPWHSAQEYCRQKHTDLVTVHNESENKLLANLVNELTWIGYYRVSWSWSDGQPSQPSSFSVWDDNEPNIRNSCATMRDQKWHSQPCTHKYPFVCNAFEKRQVRLKVVLTRSDPFLDLDEMKNAILQQLIETMMKHGLSEQSHVKWIKQPDGKTFH